MSNGRRPATKNSIDGLVGSSPAMQHVFLLARRAAGCSANVLLQGETGTGKCTLALAIHRLGGRKSAPFHRIHCATIDEAALETMLFGSDSSGLLQQSDDSTLLIEEINLMSARLQARMLKALEARMGSESERPPEMERQQETENSFHRPNRLIASSSCDLAKEVAENRFREDLFWRLSVLPITLPPLRRRAEDVEGLVRKFLECLCSTARTVDKIHPDALTAMRGYQWPGNIRELQNYVERAFVAADSQELTPDLLPTSVLGDRQAAEEAVFRPTDEKSLVHEFVYNRLRKAPGDAADLHKQIVEPIEKELLVQILNMCNNVQKTAADRLGINRNTLYKKLKEYGLDKSNAKASPDENDTQ